MHSGVISIFQDFAWTRWVAEQYCRVVNSFTPLPFEVARISGRGIGITLDEVRTLRLGAAKQISRNSSQP